MNDLFGQRLDDRIGKFIGNGIVVHAVSRIRKVLCIVERWIAIFIAQTLAKARQAIASVVDRTERCALGKWNRNIVLAGVAKAGEPRLKVLDAGDKFAAGNIVE